MRKILAAACLLAVPTLANAQRTATAANGLSQIREPMERILQDDAVFLHSDAEELNEQLARARRMGFTQIRVTASWHRLSRGTGSAQVPAFDATDPAAYEQHRWRNLDRLVRRANEHGIGVMIDIAFWAPVWATDDDPAEVGVRGRTNIDVDAYAQFAEAVTRRYSGSFDAPVYGLGGSGSESGSRWLPLFGDDLSPADDVRPAEEAISTEVLPRVSTVAIWNEPNITGFWLPQWQGSGEGRRAVSPHAYRRMVQRAHASIKAANPHMRVLIGNLAPTGSYAAKGLGGGVPPLRFLREMACVDEDLQPMRDGECSDFQSVPGDGLAYHPYQFHQHPSEGSQARRGDDARIGDLAELAALLRNLHDRGRVAPGVRNIYINEYGYQTSHYPHTVSPAMQAEWMMASEYEAWQVPQVRSFAQFLVRDHQCEHTGQDSCLNWHTGMYTPGGEAKPLASAMELGVYARQQDRHRVKLFATLRERHRQGELVAEYRRGDAWVALPASRVIARRQDGGHLEMIVGPIRGPMPSGWRLRWRSPSGQDELSHPAGVDRHQLRRPARPKQLRFRASSRRVRTAFVADVARVRVTLYGGRRALRASARGVVAHSHLRACRARRGTCRAARAYRYLLSIPRSRHVRYLRLQAVSDEGVSSASAIVRLR